MKKLLLLLCAIGANAAFAETATLECLSKDPLFKTTTTNVTVSGNIDKVNNVIKLKQPDYDKYVTKCIKELGSSQQVVTIQFKSLRTEEPLYVSDEYNDISDRLNANPLIRNARAIIIANMSNEKVAFMKDYNRDTSTKVYIKAGKEADTLFAIFGKKKIEPNNRRQLEQTLSSYINSSAAANYGMMNKTISDGLSNFILDYMHQGGLTGIVVSAILGEFSAYSMYPVLEIATLEVKGVSNNSVLLEYTASWSLKSWHRVWVENEPPVKPPEKDQPIIEITIPIILNFNKTSKLENIQIPEMGFSSINYTKSRLGGQKAFDSSLQSMMILSWTSLYQSPEKVFNSDKWKFVESIGKTWDNSHKQ